MTQVKMPDPATYPPDDWVKEFFGEPDECGFYSFYGDFGNIAYRFQCAAKASNIITTTQAEAYANDRVREVLERAAGIIRANAEACDSGTRIMLRANAEAVLALIPSTPARPGSEQ